MPVADAIAPVPIQPPKPAPPVDDRDEYELLDALIDRLNTTPVMTPAQEAALEEKYREKMTDWIGLMLDEGQTYGQASGDLEIFNQPEADFRAEIRATDNDLIVQIDRFNHGLNRWFDMAEIHPPYYPWRIAVILSKRKELERERRFLAAYCRHFADQVGGTQSKFAIRAAKKGAFDQFNRG